VEQAGTQERSALFAGEGSSTLALVVYLALAILLMLADRRGDYLEQFRRTVARASEPLYTLAELPSLVGVALRDGLANRRQLQADNEALAATLRETRLRLAEAELQLAEQRRLAGGLALAEQERLHALPARVLDVDPDPFRHRIIIDRGEVDGLVEGSALIDAAGVVGQLIELGARRSVVLLISDPGHGLPIVNARSGERSLLHGTGESDTLALRSMPLTADFEPGDLLLSSGLGGRIPAGLPVARVRSVERSAGAPYARGLADPLAELARARELLAVAPRQEPAGPPDPALAAAPAGEIGPAQPAEQDAPDPTATDPAAPGRAEPDPVDPPTDRSAAEREA
jgi:rod shape-determining protein MreC